LRRRCRCAIASQLAELKRQQIARHRDDRTENTAACPARSEQQIAGALRQLRQPRLLPPDTRGQSLIEQWFVRALQPRLLWKLSQRFRASPDRHARDAAFVRLRRAEQLAQVCDPPAVAQIGSINT